MSGWSWAIKALLAVIVAWGCGLPGSSVWILDASEWRAVSKRHKTPSGPQWRRVIVLGGIVAVASAVGLVVTPVLTVLGALVAGALVRAHRRRIRRQSQADDAAALPEALELCQVTLGAGGTVLDCMRVLATHSPEPVRSAAQEGVRVASDGSRLDSALRRFQERLGLAFQPLTGALLLGWRQGGSIGLLLQRLTIEANASRRRLGEIRARRLPVQLLAPLVLLALPAVVLGAIVPIVIVAVRDLDP